MWLRLDDAYADHPKVEEALGMAGPGVVLLHVRLMCYAAKHLTDGRVPKSAAERLAHDAGDGALEALVEVGLLHADGRHLVLSDWLDYNPPAEEVKAKRKARSARAKRAASARWNAKGNAPGSASSITASNATRTDSGDAPVPVPVPVPSSSERRDRRDPSGQSATAREEPERNPHEPSEATPPERRTLLGAEHERLAAVIVRELDEARGYSPPQPNRQSDLSALARLCREQGSTALQVARRYIEDDHPSTASLTVRELLGCWSRMRGLLGRPTATASRRAGRGYDQLDPEIVALYAEEG